MGRWAWTKCSTLQMFWIVLLWRYSICFDMDKEMIYFYFAVMVRTILPSTIPPSYRGATIRYLYFIRSILSGQYLIMENGHFNEESIRDLAELVSSLLFCSSFIYPYHLWSRVTLLVLWHALVTACLIFLYPSQYPECYLVICFIVLPFLITILFYKSATCQSWIY